MTSAPDYNLIAGTVRGALIYTSDDSRRGAPDLKFVRSERPSEITALSYGASHEEVLIGRHDGVAAVFDIVKGVAPRELPGLDGDGRVVSHVRRDGVHLVSKEDGIVNLWRAEGDNGILDTGIGDNSSMNASELNLARDVLATGGEANDLKLWDVSAGNCIFRAKSLGHDSLNLPIPTSIRGVTFVREDVYLTVCCTKEGHVLMYDDRAQRRPVMKFLEKQASYTTISMANRERQCLVGTTRGYMQLIDLKTAKCLRTFKSFNGSVTGICCDPLEPYVVTSSLDRFVRVHHLDTKALVRKFYLKQSITKLLVGVAVKKEEKDDEDDKKGVEVDEEYESIFEKMETVGSPPSKKRKKKENR